MSAKSNINVDAQNQFIDIDLNNVKAIFPNGDIKKYPKPLKVIELLNHQSLSSSDIIALMINGKIESLNSKIKTGIAKINPIILNSYEGLQIYKSTIIQILATVIHKLYSTKFHIIVLHEVKNGFLIQKSNEESFNEDEICEIKKKINEIIKMDFPIQEINLSHDEALNYFNSINHKFSVKLIESNNNDTIKCICIDKFITLFFKPLAKSTGIIKDFDFRLSSDNHNCLLLYSINENNTIPKEINQIETKNIIDNYLNSWKYSKLINTQCVGDWNKIVISSPETLREAILTMNMNQERDILSIADRISEKVMEGKVKLIGIAGPSASGKTTFSKKIGIALKSKGIESIVICMDDYAKNRVDSPKDENGKYDFECIEALRIDEFNKDLLKLLKGEEIERCVFDFISGTYSYLKNEKLKLPSKESNKIGVIICEGLHGINEKVTPLIPREEKYYIYIAPLTPIKFDEYNFFPDQILRLYRRIIRDFRNRGYNASKTLNSFFNVSKGEDKYISPHIDKCDLIWNSSLDYEVSVLYPFVYPLLKTVNVSDPNYHFACYLMDAMNNFLPISDEDIEKTALLREFIGGSTFE